jgi:hypothetical protein
MKKKTERLHRLVQKLASKYGKKDEDVLRLQAELDTLVLMEKTVGKDADAAKVVSTGPSPAKLLYLEAQRGSKQ